MDVAASRSFLSARLHAWLAGHPEDTILQWLFRGIVGVTIAVLAADFATVAGWTTPNEAVPDETAPAFTVPAILAPLLPGGDRRLTPMPQADGRLGKPMTFELTDNGRLTATGTITPGVHEAFAAEIARRGDYVRTVVLNSPGGSVSDALAMGRLIREKKFATEVEAGKYCASSCPLMFVGGFERRAGDKAAIGVHQVFALSSADNAPVRDDMGDAQRISARCQRYLGDMGINLQMWVHAMETPKDKLFVFKPDELKALHIVTTGAEPVPALPPAAPPAPGKSRM